MRLGRRWLLVPLLGAVVVGSCLASTRIGSRAAAAASPCQFQKADPGVNVAFCETFDAPAGIGNRSGDLNGSLWGVSRAIGHTNFGQGQYQAASPTVMQKCGTAVTVQPANDVAICNGMVVEAVNDDHDVTALAMYPKQPFDIGGRTGTIAFDVSDDSHGTHRAWPELWYTDQPVPVPFTHFDSFQSVPRNGIGVRFADGCAATNSTCLGRWPSVPTGPWVTVDSADIVTNFQSNDSTGLPAPPAGVSPVNVQVVDAVRMSSGVGNMNHFELRLSSNQIDVWGTDGGAPTSTARRIAIITNFSMPLTRGLVWLEDAHYNGDKDGPDQGTHTFSWDNLGFDGPTLPRDLTFDVNDNTAKTGSYTNLGWAVDPYSDLSPTYTVNGVYNTAGAAGAAVLTSFYSQGAITLSVRVNGGPWLDQPWPYPSTVTTWENKTIAIPVPLAEVHDGVNTVQFKSSNPATSLSNIDLALLAAGGGAPPPTTTTVPPTTTPTTIPSTTTTVRCGSVP